MANDLTEAVARVRVEIEAAFPPGKDSYCAITRGDLRTILAALPTPEERQQINGAILCVEYVAADPASQRHPYRARVWQHCAATIRNYLTRTGGATDGN